MLLICEKNKFIDFIESNYFNIYKFFYFDFWRVGKVFFNLIVGCGIINIYGISCEDKKYKILIGLWIFFLWI